MGCGCKISTPTQGGDYVDHSECQFESLRAQLVEQQAMNKSGADWAFRQIDELKAELAAKDKELAQLRDTAVAMVYEIESVGSVALWTLYKAKAALKSSS